jgi:hypothetical protein
MIDIDSWTDAQRDRWAEVAHNFVHVVLDDERRADFLALAQLEPDPVPTGVVPADLGDGRIGVVWLGRLLGHVDAAWFLHGVGHPQAHAVLEDGSEL